MNGGPACRVDSRRHLRWRLGYTMVGCQRRSLTPKSSLLTRLFISFATAVAKQNGPPFSDLCKEHAEQFAAIHKLDIPALRPALGARVRNLNSLEASRLRSSASYAIESFIQRCHPATIVCIVPVSGFVRRLSIKFHLSHTNWPSACASGTGRRREPPGSPLTS